jgi:hypothetical protein
MILTCPSGFTAPVMPVVTATPRDRNGAGVIPSASIASNTDSERRLSEKAAAITW